MSANRIAGILDHEYPDRTIENVTEFPSNYAGVFEVTLESNESIVLKVAREEEKIRGLRTEACALHHLADVAAIPTLRASDPSGTGNEPAYLIADRCPGRPSDEVYDSSDETGRQELCRELGMTIARVHESWSFRRYGVVLPTDPPKIEFKQAIDTWIDLFPTFIEDQIESHLRGTEFDESARAGMDYLRGHRELLEVGQPVAVNQELCLANVLVEEGPAVTFVDWDRLLAGDAVYGLWGTITDWQNFVPDFDDPSPVIDGYRRVRDPAAFDRRLDLYAVLASLDRMIQFELDTEYPVGESGADELVEEFRERLERTET